MAARKAASSLVRQLVAHLGGDFAAYLPQAMVALQPYYMPALRVLPVSPVLVSPPTSPRAGRSSDMRYKPYFLDPSGRTNRASECDYEGDDLAIAGAGEERGESDAELWRGRMMVMKFRRVRTHNR